MDPVRDDISISEVELKFKAVLLKRDQLIEKDEKLKQRLLGLDLRMQVIQDEIQRIKKEWKIG